MGIPTALATGIASRIIWEGASRIAKAISKKLVVEVELIPLREGTLPTGWIHHTNAYARLSYTCKKGAFACFSPTILLNIARLLDLGRELNTSEVKTEPEGFGFYDTARKRFVLNRPRIPRGYDNKFDILIEVDVEPNNIVRITTQRQGVIVCSRRNDEISITNKTPFIAKSIPLSYRTNVDADVKEALVSIKMNGSEQRKCEHIMDAPNRVSVHWSEYFDPNETKTAYVTLEF